MTYEPTLLVVHSDQRLRHRINDILGDFKLLHCNPQQLAATELRFSTAVRSVRAVVIVAVDEDEASICLSEIRRSLDTERVTLIAALPRWAPREVVGYIKRGFDEVISLNGAEEEIRSIISDSITAGVGARFPGFLGAEIKRFEEYEAVIFRHALEESNGCVSRAAAALGVGRATMYRKIRCYDIEVPVKSVRRASVKRPARVASAI